MVLLTFRVALPSSAKSLWKCSHRERTCLLGNPKGRQVDVEMNHVTWVLLCGASETEGLNASKPQPGGSPEPVKSESSPETSALESHTLSPVLGY